MLLLLDKSGHYPNRLIEVTETEYENILRVEGKGYLQDTEEGRNLLFELDNRPKVPCKSIIAYI